MNVNFVTKEGKIVGSIGLEATRVFLTMTRLAQSELGKRVPSGFAPLVSDEVLIDEEQFVEFADEFFKQAAHNGKFRYFGRWAEDIAGMYENITGNTPERKISGVENFTVRRYR